MVALTRRALVNAVEPTPWRSAGRILMIFVLLLANNVIVRVVLRRLQAGRCQRHGEIRIAFCSGFPAGTSIGPVKAGPPPAT